MKWEDTSMFGIMIGVSLGVVISVVQNLSLTADQIISIGFIGMVSSGALVAVWIIRSSAGALGSFLAFLVPGTFLGLMAGGSMGPLWTDLQVYLLALTIFVLGLVYGGARWLQFRLGSST